MRIVFGLVFAVLFVWGVYLVRHADDDMGMDENGYVNAFGFDAVKRWWLPFTVLGAAFFFFTLTVATHVLVNGHMIY